MEKGGFMKSKKRRGILGVFVFLCAGLVLQFLTAASLVIPAGALRIYTIQGEGHVSAFQDKLVKNVYGVVTAAVFSKGKQEGFYMQDPEGDGNKKTSDGIYVHCPACFPPALQKGDLVCVSGTVQEYAYKKKDAKGNFLPSADLSRTQIFVDDAGGIKTVKQNLPLPAPIEIGYADLAKPVFTGSLQSLNPEGEAIDFYESLEGMRVSVINPVSVAPYHRGTNYITPCDTPERFFTGRGGIIYNGYEGTPLLVMHTGKCLYPAPDYVKHISIGDRFKGRVTGIVSYAYSQYQIEVSEELPQLVKADFSPESSKIAFDKNSLNIASYNVRNFSFGNSGDEKRAAIFARHFTGLLKSPDIICLIEIQDDDGSGGKTETSAAKTLELLIESVKKHDSSKTYNYVNIDPEKNKDGGIPNGNIRCCFLYRTDRIEVVPAAGGKVQKYSGKNGHSDELPAVIEKDGKRLKHNPARIGVGKEYFTRTRKSLAAHFKFKDGINGGKDFFVIGNHFSSKRGDDPVWGSRQPAKRSSEERRHLQADEVIAFIDSIKEKRSDAVIISAGDYNDFWFSQTAAKFKAAGMKNAVESLPEKERYTYVYAGHSQTLDNVFVLNAGISYADILNINAEFPETAVSDHDPVFVQVKW